MKITVTKNNLLILDEDENVVISFTEGTSIKSYGSGTQLIIQKMSCSVYDTIDTGFILDSTIISTVNETSFTGTRDELKTLIDTAFSGSTGSGGVTYGMISPAAPAVATLASTNQVATTINFITWATGIDANGVYLIVDASTGTADRPLTGEFTTNYGEDGVNGLLITLATNNSGVLDNTANTWTNIMALSVEGFNIEGGYISPTDYFADNVYLQFSGGTNEGIDSTGIPGQMLYNEQFLYICVATDTWKGVKLLTITELYQ